MVPARLIIEMIEVSAPFEGVSKQTMKMPVTKPQRLRQEKSHNIQTASTQKGTRSEAKAQLLLSSYVRQRWRL